VLINVSHFIKEISSGSPVLQQTAHSLVISQNYSQYTSRKSEIRFMSLPTSNVRSAHMESKSHFRCWIFKNVSILLTQFP